MPSRWWRPCGPRPARRRPGPGESRGPSGSAIAVVTSAVADTEERLMTRFVLPESQLPTAWFNVLPRLAVPLDPPLHPGTRQPVGPDDLAPLFPMALIEQEMSPTPWIDIPGEVLDILRLWRPTPLIRAERLEAALGTPARIYFKDESVSPAGSHKPNTAVAQAYYNQQEGI